MKSHQLLFGILVMSNLVGCSQVRETGRRQIMLMTHGQEVRAGTAAWASIQTQPVSRNLEATAMVERVAKRVADACGHTGFAWEVRLFESPNVNAFCLPGGKMGVLTGILPVTENEAALAVLMGHEIAHATCRHGAERYSQRKVTATIGSVLANAAGSYAPMLQRPVAAAYNFGTTAGVALPFSRQHESEADHLGLIFAARAGYDPQEAIAFWERMQQAAEKSGKDRPPAWLSTHPRETKRIEKLREYMAEALAVYDNSTVKYGRGDLIPLRQTSPEQLALAH